jgi:Fe-S oxidoreductase
MDDRQIMRFQPGYGPIAIDTQLDWSEWLGFERAVEMCNNNGACRKAQVGTMCPSYRVTGDEQHLTRGRANTLRLAITGQLGKDAFTSDALYDTMDLCVGCKGCKRECPTGVDMAKMKTEFLYHYRARHGLPLRERLIAYLPRYVHRLKGAAFLMNLRDRIPAMAKLSEKLLGLTAQRKLPTWRKDHFKPIVEDAVVAGGEKEVVLLVDTFNGCFETENAIAAMAVLSAAGYHVHCPLAEDHKRPLCCGRTFFSAGLLDEARVEAQRTLEALAPFVARGVPCGGIGTLLPAHTSRRISGLASR